MKIYDKIISELTPDLLARVLSKVSSYCPEADIDCDDKCYVCFRKWLDEDYDRHENSERDFSMSCGILKPKPEILSKCCLGILEQPTFVYGGFERKYEKTAGEWAAETEWLGAENRFITCPICHKDFDREKPVSTGAFYQKSNDTMRLHIICKDCAYKISPVVIEADGSEIKSSTWKGDSNE